MLEISLFINSADAESVQAVAYECEGQKKIVKELILDNADNPAVLEGAAFKKYNEMYQQTSANFEHEKARIESKYVPAELRALGAETSWNLSYNDREMIITVKSNTFDETWSDIKFSEDAEDVSVRVLEKADTPCNCDCKCQ